MLSQRLCCFHDGALFISDAESAGDLTVLRHHGITHVISALPIEPIHPTVCKYLIIPIVDSDIEDLIPHLPGTAKFISDALKDGEHSAAGISRSSSICINFLMVSTGLSYEDAFTKVKSARAIVCPNPGFREQLRLFAEMGFVVEGVSAAHRQYRQRKVWNLVHQGQSRSAKLERLLQPDPAFDRVSGKVYACVDCGRRLFAESNIIPLHEGRTCGVDNFPIDAMRWMKPNAFPVGNDVPVQCPGCNSPIGKFHFKLNWRCVCNLGWTPSIRIRRTKVKVALEELVNSPPVQAVDTRANDLTLLELEEDGKLLRTDSGIVVSAEVSATLPTTEQVHRVPGKFCAYDFVKVFARHSMTSRTGLYLCGAGGRTDESTIRELLTQDVLGCSLVAVVHDLFDRTVTLKDILIKHENDVYIKNGILGPSNPRRRIVVEWSRAEGKLAMGKSATELGQYLRGLGLSVIEVDALGSITKALALSPTMSNARQSTNCVLMVAPVGFAHNVETAADNTFMSKPTSEQCEVERMALADFGRIHAALTEAGVKVTLFVNSLSLGSPDAVFPNNWFSTHLDSTNKRGTYVLYPMKAPSRRRERRADIISFLKTRYAREISLTEGEAAEEPCILEGTGSLVLDRIRRVCYLALSPRADLALAKKWATLMEYTVVPFKALDANQRVVYHTNVVMSIGTSFAVVCAESIVEDDRARVLAKLKEHRGVIEITMAQMGDFCGNVLEVATTGGRIAAMSTRAHNAFTLAQRELLLKKVDRLVHADIGTIETVGGGGVRCMLAELF